MLLIFQAMDAAGKDSAIKHVMSGIDPKGCQVYSFKAPSSEELDHDFMWRTSKCLPERGRIGIFNRSYYEETLVVRVHPEFLGKQKLPAELITPADLAGAVPGHQRVRALSGAQRVRDPEVLPQRLARRTAPPLPRAARPAGEELEVLARGSGRARAVARLHGGVRRHDPPDGHAARAVVVIPADDKKFARTVVAAAVIDALNGLNLQFPGARREQKRGSGARAAACSSSESRRTKS